MFRVTRRWLLLSYFVLMFVWFIVIVVVHIIVDRWSCASFLFETKTKPFLGSHPQKLGHHQLQLLMVSSLLDEQTVAFPDPLAQLLAPGNKFLHFFSLPKRKTHLIYNEV